MISDLATYTLAIKGIHAGKEAHDVKKKFHNSRIQSVYQASPPCLLLHYPDEKPWFFDQGIDRTDPYTGKPKSKIDKSILAGHALDFVMKGRSVLKTGSTVASRQSWLPSR